jgi:Trp operon repressor
MKRPLPTISALLVAGIWFRDKASMVPLSLAAITRNANSLKRDKKTEVKT